MNMNICFLLLLAALWSDSALARGGRCNMMADTSMEEDAARRIMTQGPKCKEAEKGVAADPAATFDARKKAACEAAGKKEADDWKAKQATDRDKLGTRRHRQTTDQRCGGKEGYGQHTGGRGERETLRETRGLIGSKPPVLTQQHLQCFCDDDQVDKRARAPSERGPKDRREFEAMFKPYLDNPSNPPAAKDFIRRNMNEMWSYYSSLPPPPPPAPPRARPIFTII